jgi:hypothetical protein
VRDETTEALLRNHMQEVHAFIVRILTVVPRETWPADTAAKKHLSGHCSFKCDLRRMLLD